MGCVSVCVCVMEEGWRAHVVRLEIVSMGVLSLRHFILKYFRTVLFCYPQNHSFVIKKKKKKKTSRKEVILWKWGTMCWTTSGAFMDDHLVSHCRRLGVRWQDLNGRSRSSQHHGKSGLKGNFKVLASNTLFPSSLHHLSSG